MNIGFRVQGALSGRQVFLKKNANCFYLGFCRLKIIADFMQILEIQENLGFLMISRIHHDLHHFREKSMDFRENIYIQNQLCFKLFVSRPRNCSGKVS